MAKQRTPLDVVAAAAQAKADKDEPAAEEGKDDGPNMTTAIVLPEGLWQLLRDVAFIRARKSGGRASVSAIIRSLVVQHREEMEEESAALRG